MRMNSGLWCAFALACSVVACSWGGSSGNAGNGGMTDAAAPVVCGDGICAATEVGTCAADCPTGMHGGGSGSGNAGPICGNGVCEAGETVSTCPSDCNTGSGSGSGSGAPLNCNDSTVQTECLSCLFGGSCTNVDSAGCTTCLLQGLLGSGAGSAGDDSGCVGGAPNGTCDTGETATNCVDDCP